MFVWKFLTVKFSRKIHMLSFIKSSTICFSIKYWNYFLFLFQKPFIEIKVDKQKHRRSRRMIGLNCEENADEVRCCRYPLTVDFEEFGWDWIIAPKRYEANYCSGECPYVFLQKYPHTHLVQQANPQGSAGPCCAPRKMSSISMLYFDADFNIIYGMLPGMVVDRCGCS